MQNAPKTLCVGVLSTFLISFTAPSFGLGSEKLASRLMEASGIHVIFASGIISGYRKSAERDKKPGSQIQCFTNRITPELVLPALAGAYAHEFSDIDLTAAISFFESKTGQAYARYQRIKTNEMFGSKATDAEPDFSPRDIEKINAFTQTHIGTLILTPGSPASALANEALRPKLVEFHELCKQ